MPLRPTAAGIGVVPKVVAVVGGVLASGIMALAIGSNVGHNAPRALSSVSPTPATATRYIKAIISGKGMNETIYFKIVGTDSEKRAFVDGFQKGISKSSDLSAEVDDLLSLPTNAVYVCQINMPSSDTIRSVQIYGESGDNLSRDIAQAGCDAANASS